MTSTLQNPVDTLLVPDASKIESELMPADVLLTSWDQRIPLVPSSVWYYFASLYLPGFALAALIRKRSTLKWSM